MCVCVCVCVCVFQLPAYSIFLGTYASWRLSHRHQYFWMCRVLSQHLQTVSQHVLLASIFSLRCLRRCSCAVLHAAMISVNLFVVLFLLLCCPRGLLVSHVVLDSWVRACMFVLYWFHLYLYLQRLTGYLRSRASKSAFCCWTLLSFCKQKKCSILNFMMILWIEFLPNLKFNVRIC